MATEPGALAINRDIESISKYTGPNGEIRYAYKVDRTNYIGWKCPTKKQIKDNLGGDFIGVPDEYADNRCVLYGDITLKSKQITLTIDNVAGDINCRITLYKIGSDNEDKDNITYVCDYDSPTQRTDKMTINIDDLGGGRLGIQFRNDDRSSRTLTMSLTNGSIGKFETLYYNQGNSSTDRIEVNFDTSIKYYTQNDIFERLAGIIGDSRNLSIRFLIS